jgi:hypothetical protein
MDLHTFVNSLFNVLARMVVPKQKMVRVPDTEIHDDDDDDGGDDDDDGGDDGDDDDHEKGRHAHN